ncbi:MAG TPA: efflux RND transporter permease subunit [Candidatus Levybacteria bacterium]|nr:efflux RND transporter permease subunit [Candidatus Levybacteria bacterium]
MEHITTYLRRLKFEPRLNNLFIAKYFANPRLVFLVILMIAAIGISSYIALPRRLNPEIEIPIITVVTVLPGANPEDVESLITQPIESALTSLTDVKTVTSTSQDNISVISLEFESSVEPATARDDVQRQIDQVQLPEDAQSPRVQQIDFENQPVWSFAVIGPDEASLARFADALAQRLEEETSIREVETSGLQTQEIAITISPEKVASYGINPVQLSGQIRTAAGSFPAGTVTTNTSSFTLSLDPSITSIEDIRNLQIMTNGTAVPLSSIAQIQESAKPDEFQSFFANRDEGATPTITFNVYKSQSANINTAVSDSEKVVEEVLEEFGHQFQVQSITNSGELIDEQFDELVRDFLIITGLVFLVLFIFLGARQAFVSLFAVPLTFLISFTVMRYSGISLNFLSMFSLLLSLGLLVDDTIVVISAMSSYFKTGKFTPLQTGLLVWRDFGIAILTTTLTTVWAFLPLLLAGGIIGEFIKSIPIVVSSTLLASLFVAMIITLPLMIILLAPTIPHRVNIFLRILLAVSLAVAYFIFTPKGDFLIVEILAFFIFIFVLMITRDQLVARIRTYFMQQKKRKGTPVNRFLRYSDSGVISFSRIDAAYRSLLTRILSSRINRRNTILMVVLLSLFSYLLVPLGFVKNEFFPNSDQESFYVSLELPAGTNRTVTEKESKAVMETLRITDDVLYVTADFGRTFSETGFGGAGENTVLFSVVLPPRHERDRTSIDIAQTLRDQFKSYTKGTLVVSEVSGGPPAGADIQIKLFGDDLATLDRYAEKIVDHLDTVNGVTDAQKSIKPGTSKLVFNPNNQQLASYGITQDQIGLWLRTFASGFTLDTLKLSGSNDTDVTLRLTSDNQRVEDIYSLGIPTQQGVVPLADLGQLRLEANPTLITRENGTRTISVTAAVAPGYNIPTLNQELEQYANTQLELPNGYTWQTGGVNEENQESINSIMTAMLLSFLLIIVTMVIQFGSFRKSIIVMLVIPLSISGVFILFGLLQIPLSFPALIGILALFGIVVKNSILIVDKITANQKIGMNFEESIIDGAVSRLEAIALTSVTAIIGLIPITVSNPLWQGLGGAIIAGLTFSGTIMLFFIPVVYYYWFHPRATPKKHIKST